MVIDQRKDFTPNQIVGAVAIIAAVAWFFDVVINRNNTVVGFVYFITASIFSILWRTQVVNKSDFLIGLCKSILIGVGTSCVLFFFSIVFNQPIGNFILSRYVEGNTILKAQNLQTEGKHQEVVQLADEPFVNNFSSYAQEKLREIRRVSEDVFIVRK